MKRRPIPEPRTNGSGNGHDHVASNYSNGKGWNNGPSNGREYRPESTRHLTFTEYIDQKRAKWGHRKPGARPLCAPIYQEFFPEMVFHLRLMGATRDEVAQACNVSPNTVDVWASETDKGIPDFREAYQYGGSLADARVAGSMYHRSIGYSHDDVKVVSTRDDGIVLVPIVKHYPPDTQAGIFWLTNRQRDKWQTRQTTEMTGADGKPLMPPQLVIQPVEPSSSNNNNQ